MDDNDKQYPAPPEGIRVFRNGAGYDMQAKKIAYPPGTFAPGAPHITSDNAAALANKGRELTKQRIQEAILEQMKARGAQIKGPADAVGAAAGELWADIVLNKDAYPRDRRQTWLDISRAAGLLAERNTPQSAPGGITVHYSQDIVERLLQQTGIYGTVIDVTPTDGG